MPFPFLSVLPWENDSLFTHLLAMPVVQGTCVLLLRCLHDRVRAWEPGVEWIMGCASVYCGASAFFFFSKNPFGSTWEARVCFRNQQAGTETLFSFEEAVFSQLEGCPRCILTVVGLWCSCSEAVSYRCQRFLSDFLCDVTLHPSSV